MATNLNLDDELNAVSAIRGTGKGWIWRMNQLLRKAFLSTLNPFGTAATKNFGIHAGQVPIITNGKLNARHLPNVAADDFSGSLGSGNIPSVPASKITSGILDDNRIPNIPISKVISGVFVDGRFGAVVQTGVTITDVKLVYNRGSLRTETNDVYIDNIGPYFVARSYYTYITYSNFTASLSNTGVITLTMTLNPVRRLTREYRQGGR